MFRYFYLEPSIDPENVEIMVKYWSKLRCGSQRVSASRFTERILNHDTQITLIMGHENTLAPPPHPTGKLGIT